MRVPAVRRQEAPWRAHQSRRRGEQDEGEGAAYGMHRRGWAIRLMQRCCPAGPPRWPPNALWIRPATSAPRAASQEKNLVSSDFYFQLLYNTKTSESLPL